jgi:hypothetical protein
MNKILKVITACLVLPASFLCANTQEVQDVKDNDCYCVDNSFGYVNIGVGPLPELVPSFGIGYRAQRNHHGFDASASISRFRETTTRMGVVYNYFFSPNLQSEFYAGLGLGAKVSCAADYLEKPCFAFHPKIVFGKQYQNETNFQQFFQVEVAFPVFSLGDMAKKTWKIRERAFSLHYPKSCKGSYVPEVIFSYGIGF